MTFAIQKSKSHMKNILKIPTIIFGIILAGLSMAAIFGNPQPPEVGEPETIKINYSPQSIEYGKHLADTVSACMGWSSEIDFTKFSSRLVEGALGPVSEMSRKKMDSCALHEITI